MTTSRLDLSALAQAGLPDPGVTYDVLILGGGPAAMTAAIYAARKMMNTALITENFGGQLDETSDIENYPGFQAITGHQLVEKFLDHVRHFAIPILEGETVAEVRKADDRFNILMGSGQTFAARTVILAIGKRSRRLNVPGEKELTGKGVSYCATCDAPLFKDRRVVIAGGGNSAMTAALDLLKVARKVTMVNFAGGWQADAILLQSVQRRGSVRMLDGHQVTRIEGAERVVAVHVKDRQSGREEIVPADGIFIQIGLLPNSEPVRGLARLNERNELVVDLHCRTDVEGLFGAGDVTTVPYKQVVISAGEGAKAALSAYDYLAGRGLL